MPWLIPHIDLVCLLVVQLQKETQYTLLIKPYLFPVYLGRLFWIYHADPIIMHISMLYKYHQAHV